MTLRSILAALVFLVCCAGTQAKERPVVAARDHLGKAISALSNVESGGGKKRHANIAGVIAELNRTEAKLTEARNNKGTHIDVALKLIADAKTELDAAKEEERSKHLDKARTAMDEAMKRVKLAVSDKK